jgi:hypothetical protein
MMVFVVICDTLHCYLYALEVFFVAFNSFLSLLFIVTCVVGHKEPKSLVIAFLLSLSNIPSLSWLQIELGPFFNTFSFLVMGQGPPHLV